MTKLNLLCILIALILIVSCATNKPASPEDAAKAVKLQKEARKLANITNPLETYRFSKTENDSTAIEILEKANKLDPGNSEISFDLVSILYRNTMYIKAIEVTKKYLKKDKTGNHLFLYCLSMFFSEPGEKYFEAKDLLGKGYKEHPDNTHLGVAYTKFISPYSEKSYILRNIINEHPDCIEALDELAEVLKFTQNVTESFYLSEKVILLESDQDNIRAESHALYSSFSNIFCFDENQFSFKYKSLHLDYYKRLFELSQKGPRIRFVNHKLSHVKKTDFSKKLEELYTNAVHNIKEFNFDNLVKIRKNFIKMYFMYEKNKQNPDKLFAFHKQMIDQNLFEAYNYWLFRYAIEEDIFNGWYTNHKEDYIAVEELIKNKFRS